MLMVFICDVVIGVDGFVGWKENIEIFKINV